MPPIRRLGFGRLSLCLTLFALAGCASARTASPAAPSPTGIPVTAAPGTPTGALPTASIPPTAVPTHTSTATPPPTPTATPTATPTPALPVVAGTAVPQPDVEISFDNADRVTELARWGNGTVQQVVYSPDGTLLAVASSTGAHLYDAQTLEHVRNIEPDIPLAAVAFSPDGQVFATDPAQQADDGGIRLWNLSDGSLVLELDDDINWASVDDVAFSPDGEVLAARSASHVWLWRVRDGSLVDEQDLDTECLAFSPDGKALALGRLGTVVLWHLADGSLQPLEDRPDTHDTLGVTFSPDGALLAEVSAWGEVKLWQLTNGGKISWTGSVGRGLLRRRPVSWMRLAGVSFSADGQLLAAAGGDTSVYVWQVEDGTRLAEIEGHSGMVSTVAFHPDGQILASGSPEDSVRLWQVKDGTLVGTLEEHVGPVTGLAISSDGQTVASTAMGDSVRLRSTTTGQVLRTVGESFTTDVCLSPDGQIVSVAVGENVQVREASSGALLRTLNGHTDTVRGIAFSPDGESLASASSDATVRLWQANEEDPHVYTLSHSAAVGAVAFSPDGQLLASASDDGVTRVWRVSDGALQLTLEGEPRKDWEPPVGSVVFSPDGETLLTEAGSGTRRMWRLRDGMLLDTELRSSSPTGLAWSPNGHVIALGQENGDIDLKRAGDGKDLATLSGHKDCVSSLAFTQDGKALLSASEDGTVRVWGIPEWMAPTLMQLTAKLKGWTPSLPVEMSYLQVNGYAFYCLDGVGRDDVIGIEFPGAAEFASAFALRETPVEEEGVTQPPDQYVGDWLAYHLFDMTLNDYGEAEFKVSAINRDPLTASFPGQVAFVAERTDAGDSTGLPDDTGLEVREYGLVLILHDRQDACDIERVPPAPTPEILGGMVLIPAGEFRMGCDQSDPGQECLEDELPLHSVSLNDYYIDQREVTNSEYGTCVEAGACNAPAQNGSSTRDTYYGDPGHDEHPVVWVSWDDASQYCNWLGKRLPTEAEWEKAARGPCDTRSYAWGDAAPKCTEVGVSGPYAECPEDTARGGSYGHGASPYGVLDMNGNVREWVSDWYAKDYYASSPARSPTGPATGTDRSIRGGSWRFPSTYGRNSARLALGPESDESDLGFRCALSGGELGVDASAVYSGTRTVFPANTCMLDRMILEGVEYHYTTCTTGVVVRGDGSRQVNLRWSVECSGSSTSDCAFIWGSDAGNHNLYIMDELGNRYDHFEVSEPHEYTRVYYHTDSSFAFPPFSSEAQCFVLHNEDRHIQTGVFPRTWPSIGAAASFEVTPTPEPAPTPTPTVIPLEDIVENNVKDLRLVGEKFPGPIHSLVADPAGERILVEGSETVWMYEVPSMQRVFKFPAEYEYVQRVDWSPDGKLIAIATDVGTEIWSAQDLKLVGTLDTAVFYSGQPARMSYASMDWAPDSERIVYSAPQCHVQIWDVERETLLKSLDYQNYMFGEVRWSPDGEHIAIVGQNRKVHIWDTQTWLVEDLVKRLDRNAMMEWSPTGEYLAMADGEEVQLWVQVQRFGWAWSLRPRPPYYPSDISWSPDGQMLAMADWGGYVSIWHPEQDGEIWQFRVVPEIQNIEWSPNNKWIAVGGTDGALRIYGVVP